MSSGLLDPPGVGVDDEIAVVTLVHSALWWAARVPVISAGRSLGVRYT
jgi:hypothetical protein